MWARPRTAVPAASSASRSARGRPGVDRRRGQEDLAERRQRVLPARPPGRASAAASPSVRLELLLVRPREVEVLARRPGRGRASSRWSGARSTAGRRSRRRPGRPMPSISSSRSTTPTQKPARSNSSGVHQPGMLGRLAADERAAGLAGSRRRCPPTSSATPVRVEPPDGDVVEEEQRLGAAADDVVGAHRDEVDADRVVAAERARRSRSSCRRRRSHETSTGSR